MRPGIDVHDYDFKVKAAQKFIAAGDKVKLLSDLKVESLNIMILLKI